MRHVAFATILAALSFAFVPAITPAKAGVTVQVDRNGQTMEVFVDGFPRYTWKVSTGRRGYGTPSGTFHPHWMAARWFSRVYYNAPMPHAIFFYGGFAIHGSYEIGRLGTPASHGCIRLHPNDAAVLFDLIHSEGMQNTTIVVQ